MCVVPVFFFFPLFLKCKEKVFLKKKKCIFPFPEKLSVLVLSD